MKLYAVMYDGAKVPSYGTSLEVLHGQTPALPNSAPSGILITSGLRTFLRDGLMDPPVFIPFSLNPRISEIDAVVFVGGPLDRQVERKHEFDSWPEKLYVRSTGKGRAPFAHMFLVGLFDRGEAEYQASSTDFDPTVLWVYVRRGDEYHLGVS